MSTRPENTRDAISPTLRSTNLRRQAKSSLVAADELAPHAIAFYLKDLASELHSYYNAERFLVDDLEIRFARLALLAATRQVLRNGLALIGVSAPERM